MSEIKPRNVKFQLKAIECEATSSTLIVLYSHLKFLLQQVGRYISSLVHMVLSNDTFYFESAQPLIGGHFPITISCT